MSGAGLPAGRAISAVPHRVDDGEALTAGNGCGKAWPMSDTKSDTPPDQLSTNARSPHFDMDVLQRGIGIRFKGRERKDVEEYCISEGWIRVAAGKARDRFGNPLTIKLNGEVEAWFEDILAQTEGDAEA
jgi:hypothetical protein